MKEIIETRSELVKLKTGKQQRESINEKLIL